MAKEEGSRKRRGKKKRRKNKKKMHGNRGQEGGKEKEGLGKGWKQGEEGRFVNHCQQRAGAGQVGGTPAHERSAGHQDNAHSPFFSPSFILIVSLPHTPPV
ncbi:hypothetical protein E2C01_052395 [Portunus trituberculatus]|uniref:Uncharacterized protein n=1 Tax=Portunus trituberculatus TaxID=210409 RepID=A0A5B7GEF9_PORTR|nr:hypothetical protein [Portunus trituberculatus]